MHDESSDILHDPQKGVNSAEGVLARLFRQILYDLRVSPMRWSANMTRYLDDPRNNVPRNSRDRASERGNLNKALRKPKMTWKVFRKALMFLGPIRARFIVELDWRDRRTTAHILELHNSSGDPVDTDLIDDDTESRE